MGISCHDKPSLVEAVGSLRFVEPDDMNSTPGTGLCLVFDNPNPIPDMVRDNNIIGRSDDIQLVNI